MSMNKFQREYYIGEFVESFTIVRFLSFNLVILNGIFIHYFYQQKLKLKKFEENRVNETCIIIKIESFIVTLKQAGLLSIYIVDQFINLIISYPGIDYLFNITIVDPPTTYSLSSIIQVLQFLKVLPFRDFILLVSPYNNINAQIICEKRGCQASLWFAIRVSMKLRPL